jgi:large subunit ribosomal protein L32
MPLPKRRHSSARQAKRRTHYKLTPPGVGECPRCHAPRLSHHICSACGYYNGRQWITPKSQADRGDAA